MIRTRIVAMTLFLFATVTGTIFAGDDIRMTVDGVGSPSPAVKINGNNTTQGTIQLFYTVTAFTFPVGNYATFSINMTDVHLNGANNAVYPATLTLTQNGSQELTLTPATSSFSVTGLGWSDSTNVVISIPPGVPNDDGTDLVGNLHFSIPGPNHVGTPTSVQVHVLLVWPTSCLRVYNFVTDTDFTRILTSTEVNVQNGEVKSSNPGQFSDDVLIANTCGSSQSIDLGIQLDSRWETNPHGNPGNAVFTYSTSSIINPNTFKISAFGTGTARQQNLCLQNLTIPAGTSFLATVHSQVIKGLSQANLGSSPFTHSASLRASNTQCTGVLNPVASPNPISTNLAFTIK